MSKSRGEFSVSVAIPTLNRREVLENTVHELLATPSRTLVEVLVVDQSDEPNSVLQNIQDARLHYFHVPFKGLTKARNFAIARASGGVILFLDDDVTGLSKTVDAHAKAHARYNVEIVTGPALSPGKDLISADCLSPTECRTLALGRGLNMQAGFVYSPIYALGCNVSFRRDVFARCGGFDENFVGSAVGEDAEMSHRVRMNFGRIIYDPDASVIHLSVPSGGCRDETQELRRFETEILNAHYFHHRIEDYKGLRSVIWSLVRVNVFNRSALRPRNWPRTLRWCFHTISALGAARSRTARMMNVPPPRISALEDSLRSAS